jgi:hypothetical protein
MLKMNLFNLIFYIYLWIDYSTTDNWTSNFKLIFAIISTPSILYELYYILGLRLYLVKYLVINSIDYLIPGLSDHLYTKYYEKSDSIFRFFIGGDEGHFNCYLNFRYMSISENYINKLKELDDMEQVWSVNSNKKCSSVKLLNAEEKEEIYVFNNRDFRYIDPPDTKNLYINIYESKGNIIKSNLIHKIKLKNHMLREGFERFHTILRFSHYNNISIITENEVKYKDFMFAIKSDWDDEVLDTIEFFVFDRLKNEKDKLSELVCFENYIIVIKEERHRVYVN